MSKWYVTPPEEVERAKLESDVNRVIAARIRGNTNFVEVSCCRFNIFSSLFVLLLTKIALYVLQYQNYKLIYRRYAGLYFVFAVDITDNELLLMETIHLFVELLDQYFSNVCEVIKHYFNHF